MMPFSFLTLRRAASLSALLSLAFATTLFAAAFPISMDGAFDDWTAVPVAFTDASGDGGGSGIDFGRLWAANDGRGLFLRIELGPSLVMQESNSLTLYIDTDNNSSTGTAVAGMGADLVWEFGNRGGTYQGSSIFWDDIGLVTTPPHAGSDFEISLLRAATPGGNTLFPSNTIRIALRDNSSGGDWIPSSSTSVSYTFDDSNPYDPPAIALDKANADYLRVMTHNVKNDGLWSRSAEHGRLVQAINPDIIAYQEIYNNDGPTTLSWVQSYLPGTWYLSWSGELKIISRYPILQEWSTGAGRAWAALIDLPTAFTHDLLLINLHLKCCSTGDSQRQQQIDDVMSFIRDAESAGGSITLPAYTPIMIVGDTNMYGDAQQVTTLLTGDILDNGTYGPDFNPDWDGTALDALVSRQLSVRQTYSYYNPASSYGPSHIDRITVTGSAVTVDKSFMLHTQNLDPAVLAAAGLNAGDSQAASDHAPHVVDLQSDNTSTGVAAPAPGALRFALVNRPNPFNPQTSISFALSSAGEVRLAVFDVQGRKVTTLVDGRRSAGEYSTAWDGTDDMGAAVASGVYFARLEKDGDSSIRRMILIR